MKQMKQMMMLLKEIGRCKEFGSKAEQDDWSRLCFTVTMVIIQSMIIMMDYGLELFVTSTWMHDALTLYVDLYKDLYLNLFKLNTKIKIIINKTIVTTFIRLKYRFLYIWPDCSIVLTFNMTFRCLLHCIFHKGLLVTFWDAIAFQKLRNSQSTTTYLLSWMSNWLTCTVHFCYLLRNT